MADTNQAVSSSKQESQGKQKRPRRDRFVIVATFLAFLLLFAGLFVWLYGAFYIASWQYTPQEGDVIFQSLPRSRLVVAIEGATHSPFSHCGVVARRNNRWFVVEAFDGVEETPLPEFLFRGRGHGFAVFRLQSQHRDWAKPMSDATREYMGRPYDVRYRMDDEKIYCSELIYKAYGDVTGGEQLGELVQLRKLDWQPYAETIEYFEGGPVPLDREMITPRDLANANQLELVTSYNIAVE